MTSPQQPARIPILDDNDRLFAEFLPLVPPTGWGGGGGTVDTLGGTGTTGRDVMRAETVAAVLLLLGGVGGGSVTSVAGRTGQVQLVAADLTNVVAVVQQLLVAPDVGAARAAIGALGPSSALGLANMPAGYRHVEKWTGVQKVRPTPRADIIIEWQQPTPPSKAAGYALDVDEWEEIPA